MKARRNIIIALATYQKVIIILLLLAATQICQAAITGLPATLAPRYDVSWGVAAPATLAAPVTLAVETGALSFDGVTARWQGAGGVAVVAAPCLLSGTAPVSFTLKRRLESIALLSKSLSHTTYRLSNTSLFCHL